MRVENYYNGFVPAIFNLFHREKLKSHLQRETDLLAKHGEFKKDFSDLEEQLELITRDSTTLENSFDELHQLYVKQKAVHQCLFDRNKVIQQYMAELKSWTREDGESKEEMQRELHELEQRWAIQLVAGFFLFDKGDIVLLQLKDPIYSICIEEDKFMFR